MRRQCGADAVDIDTIEGYCHFAYLEPTELDFAQMESASLDAGYVLAELKVDVSGEVVRADCATCQGPVFWLELPGTNQRLHLEGEHFAGPLDAYASVHGWSSDHPTLELLEAPE